MKKTLYLDVDGVLWLPKGINTYKPAPHLNEFLDFILDNFEVRWLTAWCPYGKMSKHGLETLSNWIQVPTELLTKIKSTVGWIEFKTEAIRWDKPFIWIEDELLREEIETLKNKNFLDCWIKTNVFEDENALLKTLDILKGMFPEHAKEN